MNEIEQLLSDLVGINSINPDLVANAPGEAEIAAYIADWLASAGLEVHIEEVLPGRPNVVGIARGTGGGRTLLLNGHVDTVGIAGMTDLLRPRILDGRLYGRGAYDMKCGLAACMMAAAGAKKRDLRGDVIVTAVMDEEYAGLGTQAIIERYRANGAIVAEPTELQLILAHKGFVWLEVETEGVAAHGSRPHLGVDAIVKMGHLLVGLDRWGQDLSLRGPHPLLGSPSVHASLIRGGKEMSSYPDSCVLSIERRTLPGETAGMVMSELREIVARLQGHDPQLRAEVRLGLERLGMETPVNSPIVAVVKSAVEGVLRQPVEPVGLSFWTDAATLHAAGIPTVVFGPRGAGAHAMEEWVELDSVRVCAEVYLATATAFCK